MASKYRIVLASHGEQSKGMLNTVQMLLGPQENMAAYCLYPEQSVDTLKETLEEEIKEYGDRNIIFMTELVHGSPFNTLVNLARDYDINHISGMNLATLLTVVLDRDNEGATPESICEAAIEASQNTIIDVKKMLSSADDEDEEEEL